MEKIVNMGNVNMNSQNVVTVGGNSVAYGGCEVMKKEREIQQVRTQNKLTYAEALRMVNPREGINQRNRVENQTLKEIEQVNKEKVLVDLNKLVISLQE